MLVYFFLSERLAAIWNNLQCNIIDITNIKQIKM